MRMQLPCINIYQRCFLRGQSALRASETGSGTDYVFVHIIEESSVESAALEMGVNLQVGASSRIPASLRE